MAQSATIPFPSGGWNARDPLEAMDPLDAIELVNIIPYGAYGEQRLGSSILAQSDYLGIQDRIQTLISFKTQAGTERLIAASNRSGSADHVIYDVTSDPPSSLKTGLTNSQWQHVVVRNALVMVNGADQPQQINSAGAISDATYTGVADDATLVDVVSFKNRLHFIQKDTFDGWYGAVDTVTGALTEFDMGTIFKMGGALMWVATYSGQDGDGINDYIVYCSTEGEFLMYQGDDPATSWSLVARGYIGKPLSRRGKINIGGDLLMLTELGLVSMREVLSQGGVFTTITDKIQNAYREAVEDYRGNFGWELFHFRKKNLLFINVPNNNTTNVGGDIQFVVNLRTGAWCKFDGLIAVTWATFANTAIHTGTYYTHLLEFEDDGVDVTLAPGAIGENEINCQVKFAFNYFGDRARNKLFKMAKPILFDADAAVLMSLEADVDFANTAFGAATSVTGSGGSSSYIDQWRNIGAFGRCLSLKALIGASDTAFKFSSAQVIYETANDVF